MENNLAEQFRKETLFRFENSIKSDYPPKNKYFSPDNKYFFENETYTKPIDDGITFGSYFFMKIAIYDNINQTKIGEFLTNHIDLDHLWFANKSQYFLYLAEIKNGISVFDLTKKTLHSYITKDDWQQIYKYYPSPDFEKLAIIKYSNIGYSLEVFDCSEPDQLPYAILYKKQLTEPNAHYVESIIWQDHFNFDIITKEEVRLGKVFLKVKVVGVSDEGFMVECRFKDIYDKEYICFEKAQAMFNFMPDENTIWPIESTIDVHLFRKFSRNQQKIASISANLGLRNELSGEIEVPQSEVGTYWYYKDYIK
jgi:hypothetical protein